jgi:hypothetical protein
MLSAFSEHYSSKSLQDVLHTLFFVLPYEVGHDALSDSLPPMKPAQAEIHTRLDKPLGNERGLVQGFRSHRLVREPGAGAFMPDPLSVSSEPLREIVERSAFLEERLGGNYLPETRR